MVVERNMISLCFQFGLEIKNKYSKLLSTVISRILERLPGSTILLLCWGHLKRRGNINVKIVAPK